MLGELMGSITKEGILDRQTGLRELSKTIS